MKTRIHLRTYARGRKDHPAKARNLGSGTHAQDAKGSGRIQNEIEKEEGIIK